MTEERGIQLNLEPEKEPTRSSEVFYNPAMRTDRDISTGVLAVYARRWGAPLTVGDVLAGSGVRGLRYAREVEAVDRVVLNDANPLAVARIRDHLAVNECETGRFQVEQQSANALLALFSGHFQVLDLDPYGSFVPFLDAAAQSIRRDGLLGLVATDLAAPFGVYPATCLRRYGAVSARTSFGHEALLRIYLRAVVEACARHDRVFEPWLTFYERHHVRLIGVVRSDAEEAARQITRMGFLWYCPACDWRELQPESCGLDWEQGWPLRRAAGPDGCPCCGRGLRTLGPLWLGGTCQGQAVVETLAWVKEQGYREAERLLMRLMEELPVRVPYYDTHYLAQRRGSDPPSLRRLMDRLQDAGFQAARSHCRPEGIKTDAPLPVIMEAMAGGARLP